LPLEFPLPGFKSLADMLASSSICSKEYTQGWNVQWINSPFPGSAAREAQEFLAAKGFIREVPHPKFGA
jgi:hypothetical protein